MNLSEFCNPFYGVSKKSCGLKGKTSQPAIAEHIMMLSLGEASKYELTFSTDQFRKWFKGERVPKQELWVKISKSFDETSFSRGISLILNDQVLPNLMERFGIKLSEDEVPDKFAFSSALAKQFLKMAEGNGEAENIIESVYRQSLNVADFPDYVTNSQKKYSKLKTLLYSSDEHEFDEFFVCNTISKYPHRRMPEETIADVTLDKLLAVSQFILLVGMGGIGKSMMMRHLFLTSIRAYAHEAKLPIIVTLREFNDSLFDLIVDSVHRFDINFSAAHVHKMLLEGKCQILLDGLDEIKSDNMDEFQKQLDILIDRYPKNQFVMSTRRFSRFVELSRFTIMYMMPFTNDQALELIDRLVYCPEEPRLKQQFRDKLISDYFKSHSEFVRNPLLLTLMLMSYHRFADVPEKKYLFYDQAYQTLLQRHDSDKLAYKRVFHSVTDPSDFTIVFREFCAKSYRHGDYEFNRNKFEKYFNMLASVKRMKSDMMKEDNFLFDVCNSACLMYEEGQIYHFLHRSFQEYFFADYYSRQDDSTLIKLGLYLRKMESDPFDDGGAFAMLYDLAPEKVERFIFLPLLNDVFSFKTRREQYWSFLEHAYGGWMYPLLNHELIEKYAKGAKIANPFSSRKNYCDSKSIVFEKMLRILNQTPMITLDLMEDVPVRIEPSTILGGEFLGKDDDFFVMPHMTIPENAPEDKKSRLAEMMTKRYICDEQGHPIEFGCMCVFTFDQEAKDIKELEPIVKLWDDKKCPAQKQFDNVKRYYQTLAKKYEHADELDDDDF